MVFVFALVACTSTAPVATVPTEKQRCELLLKFASEEDLKRVPYQLSNLKFELVEAISAEEQIYLIKLDCFSDRKDELIEKLRLQNGVEWVREAAER